MRKAWLCLYLCLAANAMAQTPFDAPLQQTVTDAGAIEAAVDAAQEHVFALTPAPAPALATALEQARSRGVRVYLIVLKQEAYAPEVTQLARQGVEIRTLPSLTEGVLVADYRYLFEGGFVSGADKATQYLDIDTFGGSFIAQLRALWQVAEPWGG